MQYVVSDEDAERMGHTMEVIIAIAAGLLIVLALLGWGAYRFLAAYLG